MGLDRLTKKGQIDKTTEMTQPSLLLTMIPTSKLCKLRFLWKKGYITNTPKKPFAKLSPRR